MTNTTKNNSNLLLAVAADLAIATALGIVLYVSVAFINHNITLGVWNFETIFSTTSISIVLAVAVILTVQFFRGSAVKETLTEQINNK